MFRRSLRLLFAIGLLVVGPSATIAKPKEWTQGEAIAEAQHDIRMHHIKFYWHGTIASAPVGVPDQYVRMVDRYPHADGGIGCIVYDRALRGRQRKYSERYNKLMLSYLLQKK